MKSTSGRNNGFRKVAKWVLGVAAVAGVASGNVLANEAAETPEPTAVEQPSVVEQPAAEPVSENPPAADVTEKESPSKEPMDKQTPAAEVSDKKSRGLFSRSKSTKDKKEKDTKKSVSGSTYTSERRNLYNQILQSLPQDLATEAGKYTDFDELPKDLAEKVKYYHFNRPPCKLLDKLPKNLVDQALLCHPYDGLPVELMDEIINHLHPLDPNASIKREPPPTVSISAPEPADGPKITGDAIVENPPAVEVTEKQKPAKKSKGIFGAFSGVNLQNVVKKTG
ncbi:spherical body protein 2 truncated copy 12, putative [Babesia ovis]|uniref:Spherical body protein 2 truncated copy 12, putative n=1 Tax=Babesia ovis TaxID=5869 RepID=A0A9W5WUW4_BABOV|nr:spherical body protein 2 truncated copy 12, putative [Babesia ovis]